MQRLLIILSLLWFISSGCNRKPATGTNTKADSVQPLTPSARIDWPFPNWTAKAKVTIQRPGIDLNFTVSLRAIKSDAVWFSANAFGLMEVARGLLKTDSIFIWDKINGRVLVGDISALHEYLPVQMNVTDFQYFLMGHIFWDSLLIGQRHQKGDSSLIIGNLDRTNFRVAIWKDYFLHSVQASNSTQGVTLDVQNEDFRNQQGTAISFRRRLVATENNRQGKSKSAASFDFVRFEFSNQLPDMPFEPPHDIPRQALN